VDCLEIIITTEDAAAVIAPTIINFHYFIDIAMIFEAF